MSEWRHKDEWSKRGNNFLVMVSRHSTKKYELVDDQYAHTEDLEHKWCIYAYIYPKHPHFSKFEGEDMWQDASNFFAWHCGCTFLEYHRNGKGDVVSIQVGCDYNHIYDDRFLMLATKESAYEVFGDADDLFDVLTSMNLT